MHPVHRRIFWAFRARSLARPLCFVSSEKKCILTCAILVQFHSFKVLRYISDRSLMPCLSLIAAFPPLVRLFPARSRLQRERTLVYCNTCIRYCCWSRVRFMCTKSRRGS